MSSRQLRHEARSRRKSAGHGRSVIEAIRGLWRDNRLIFRTWLFFIAIFVGLWIVFLYFGESARERATAWTAWLTAETLRLLWIDAEVRGDEVISSISSITVILECTAVFPCILLVSAIFAYPARIRSKLVGLVWTVPALLVINQVRLISLVFILGWFPELFQISHLVVWQSLIIIATLALWVFWTSRVEAVHRSSVPR